jgi:hypothetical protein
MTATADTYDYPLTDTLDMIYPRAGFAQIVAGRAWDYLRDDPTLQGDAAFWTGPCMRTWSVLRRCHEVYPGGLARFVENETGVNVTDPTSEGW